MDEQQARRRIGDEQLAAAGITVVPAAQLRTDEQRSFCASLFQ